jgi:hypothetical protein
MDLEVQRVAVLFEDGHSETVKLGGGALVAMERRFKGFPAAAPIESSYYGAWWALGRPGVGSDDDTKFEHWLESVDALQSVDETVDPTQPAP